MPAWLLWVLAAVALGVGEIIHAWAVLSRPGRARGARCGRSRPPSAARYCCVSDVFIGGSLASARGSSPDRAGAPAVAARDPHRHRRARGREGRRPPARRRHGRARQDRRRGVECALVHRPTRCSSRARRSKSRRSRAPRRSSTNKERSFPWVSSIAIAIVVAVLVLIAARADGPHRPAGASRGRRAARPLLAHAHAGPHARRPVHRPHPAR